MSFRAERRQFAPDRLVTATFHGGDWLTGGGKLGSEASLLAFPVIGVMFVAFPLLYPAAVEIRRYAKKKGGS